MLTLSTKHYFYHTLSLLSRRKNLLATSHYNITKNDKCNYSAFNNCIINRYPVSPISNPCDKNQPFILPFINNQNLSNNSARKFVSIAKSAIMPPLSPNELVKKFIDANNVMAFTKSYCPFCHRVKDYMVKNKIPFEYMDLDLREDGPKIQDALKELTGQHTVPNIFIKGAHIGGCDNFFELVDAGRLADVLERGEAALKSPQSADSKDQNKEYPEPEGTFDYDLIVIGGGSGGLASSKMAQSFGKKVAVFDFIVPTPMGTTWGLGGTCVNVGCVPKKLMHQAALLNEDISDSVSYGWKFLNDEHSSMDTTTSAAVIERDSDRSAENKGKDMLGQNMKTNDKVKDTVKNEGKTLVFSNPRRQLDWGVMVQAIQDNIHRSNFSAKATLRTKGIDYFNAYARFVDPHTLEAKDKHGKVFRKSSKYFIVASGLRPHYLDIPGAVEYCITSDDLFSLPYPPGKTLCVGASYIALECAGFLHGIGFQTTVMVRSIVLRHFDREMAERVANYMKSHGVTFIRPAIPIKIEKISDGKPGILRVHYKIEKTDENPEERIETEDFNTVILAIGRTARTEGLGLEEIGVKLHPKTKKLIVDNAERSSVPHIFAVGDNIQGRQELTPVAIEAGRLLTRRLFNHEKTLCDYDSVPTTVFTPLEYGSCGLTEEAAIEKYGKDDIEVYYEEFRPLEWNIPERESNACYGKLICIKSLKEKVVGFHYLGPKAGEITQGYAVAIKIGATKADFDRTIGIHPTQSEMFTTLVTTKSGPAPDKKGGC